MAEKLIKPFSLGQEEELNSLISRVFTEFIGIEYTEQGNKVFSDFVKPEKLRERYKQGNLILTYQVDGAIIGMIEVRDNNHVCLFFVDKNHQHKGIGKKLLKRALEEIKGKTNFLEVNASPFSEKIYAKLGFTKTGEKTETDGITFIPMNMEL